MNFLKVTDMVVNFKYSNESCRTRCLVDSIAVLQYQYNSVVKVVYNIDNYRFFKLLISNTC